MSDTKGDNKAFELYEMRQEIMNIDYNLKVVEKSCSTLNINLKKTEIVQKEIEKLDDKCRVYDRCCRIFVLSTKPKMIEKLAETKKKMISELEAQNEKRKYLEKNMTEKTKNYMEMVKGAEKR